MSAETSCIIVATANPALVRTLTLHETGEHDLLRAWHAFADHKHRQLRSIAGDWHRFPFLVRAPYRRLRCMGNLPCVGLIL
jgi:hypothetical protein